MMQDAIGERQRSAARRAFVDALSDFLRASHDDAVSPRQRLTLAAARGAFERVLEGDPTPCTPLREYRDAVFAAFRAAGLDP